MYTGSIITQWCKYDGRGLIHVYHIYTCIHKNVCVALAYLVVFCFWGLFYWTSSQSSLPRSPPIRPFRTLTRHHSLAPLRSLPWLSPPPASLSRWPLVSRVRACVCFYDHWLLPETTQSTHYLTTVNFEIESVNVMWNTPTTKRLTRPPDAGRGS